MILSVVRDEVRGTGIEGRLYLDGLLVGPTLERQAVAIPPGIWLVRRHESPKFGRPTIHLYQRSDGLKRGYILIHEGAIPEHSEGCILLGRTDEEGARISGGRPVVRWLEEQVFAALARGEEVRCVVHELGGDVADGEVR